jgi:hypothetical protein
VFHILSPRNVPISFKLTQVAIQFTIAENFGLLFAIVVTFGFMGYVKLRHLTRPNLKLD